MQNLKFSLAVCVAALFAVPLSLLAADTQVQTNSPAPALQEATPSKAELKKKAEEKKQAEAEAKARKEAEKAKKAELAEQKKQAEAQKQAGPQAAAKPKAEQAHPKPKVEKKGSALQPIERPPLPVSADKEQRLNDLLRKYRADAITPEQYHKERAKILAEP